MTSAYPWGKDGPGRRLTPGLPASLGGLLLVLVLVAGAADAADWPVFRGGPSLAGRAAGELRLPLRKLWSFRTGDAVRSSPVIAAGKVFVGSDDGCVYALNLADGSLAWKAKAGGAVESPPLYLNGTVYAGADDGLLYALAADTGDVRWTYRTEARIAGSANWVTLSNEVTLIVVGSYDAKLHAVDAASGTGRWTCATGGYINGAPAISRGRVVFGGCDMFLRVVDAASGAVLQSLRMDSYVPAGPAMEWPRVFLGSYDGDVICADVRDATLVWKTSAKEAAVFSFPALGARHVVYGARDMQVHGLDRATGSNLWSFAALGNVDSSPVVAGNRVVFGADDGRLYVLDLDTGSRVWSWEIGQPVKSSPAVADGVVVVGADDGGVYAFGTPAVSSGDAR